MPTKTRRSGGRKMWETVHAMGHSTFYLTEKEPRDAAKYLKQCGYPDAKIVARPLLVLDLSPDAVTALRETIEQILSPFDPVFYHNVPKSDRKKYEQKARSILTALGALPATKKHHARG